MKVDVAYVLEVRAIITIDTDNLDLTAGDGSVDDIIREYINSNLPITDSGDINDVDIIDIEFEDDRKKLSKEIKKLKKL